MFLLVPAYPGCPGSKAVKRSSMLFEHEVYKNSSRDVPDKGDNGR